MEIKPAPICPVPCGAGPPPRARTGAGLRGGTVSGGWASGDPLPRVALGGLLRLPELPFPHLYKLASSASFSLFSGRKANPAKGQRDSAPLLWPPRGSGHRLPARAPRWLTKVAVGGLRRPGGGAGSGGRGGWLGTVHAAERGERGVHVRGLRGGGGQGAGPWARAGPSVRLVFWPSPDPAGWPWERFSPSLVSFPRP